MSDEHARRREVERAIQARAILESPLWDEVYTSLANEELERLLSAGASDEQTLESKRKIRAINMVKQRFASLIETGAMAEMQLQDKKS